jgi:hypothetical protein
MTKSTGEQTVWDVIVVGGGPAGMMAAGRAAERGRRVLLLEKNATLGKKLLITGGGRCNVTNNTPDVRAMLAKYKGSDKYLFSAFAQFGVTETLSFFQDRGMVMKEEAERRMFPVSNKAQSVWNALVEYMKQGNVTVRTKSEVTSVIFNSKTDEVVITLQDGTKIRSKNCIVSTGGTSRPETGSTGDAFPWLKKMGHTVLASDSALVPIALKDSWVKRVSGVALKDIKLTSYQGGVKQKVYKGKMLFTHFGISGPAVLNMSRDIGELLSGVEGSEYTQVKTEKDDDVVIMLDLFPSLDGGALKEKLQGILIGQSNKKLRNALALLMPSALVKVLLEVAEIDGEVVNHSVRAEDRKKLVSMMKAIPLHVSGLLGKDKAVISSGGVALTEVNFKTMQSRIVPQLYLVGDVLNIDRPSGGYSLQMCWTTGYVAGSNC